jgi:hypothetical protein
MQGSKKDNKKAMQASLCDTRLIVYQGPLTRQRRLQYDKLLTKDLWEIEKLFDGGALTSANAARANAAQASAEAKGYGASPSSGSVAMLKQAIIQACPVEADHSPVPKSTVTPIQKSVVWTQPLIEHNGWTQVCSKKTRKEEKRQGKWRGKNLHALRKQRGMREQVAV